MVRRMAVDCGLWSRCGIHFASHDSGSGIAQPIVTEHALYVAGSYFSIFRAVPNFCEAQRSDFLSHESFDGPR